MIPVMFKGYFGALPKNMVKPPALFLSKEEAQAWYKTNYPECEVKRFPISSL